LEQRRVAGQEPLLGRRSEGRPEYLGESLLHLHPHRAPITATQPTATLLTDIRATRNRAMDTQATRDIPLTPVPQAMDTQAPREIPPTPVLRAMDTQTTRDIPPTPVPQAMDTQATRDTLPTPVPRAIGTRAAPHILPIPVPVTDIPCMAIPAIALRRTGRLGPSTLSNLLAESRPEVHPQSSTLLVVGKRKRICWGTESSNPPPSSAESVANLTFGGRIPASKRWSVVSILRQTFRPTDGSNPDRSSGESVPALNPGLTETGTT
jgi:hypothetical protein